MLRVPVSPLQIGLLTLDKATSHYLVDVHRARPGAEFLAFDPLGAVQARAILVLASSKSATCRVERMEPADVPAHALTVMQAFSKGTRIDQVVRDATALDATTICVVATENSALPNARELSGRLERWRKIAVESARQCGRGNIPQIMAVLPLETAFRELRAGDEARSARVILTPGASVALWDALEPDCTEDAAILIGPEGGLAERERALAIDRGFREVHLGPRVLRTEVATVVALSILLSQRCASLQQHG
jgi:16S rRNA (uracil1498-N3)-methyltransferase